MKSIDIDLDVYKTIENGRATFEESENDILRRLLGIDTRPAERTTPKPRTPRSSGAYSTTVGGQAIEANSLKELLRRVILQGEKSSPGFIRELSVWATPKGRHVVARSAEELYPRSPQLAEYGERLNDEWWYDTNVGKNQVASYFRRFAKMLGLSAIPTISKRSERTVLTLADLDLL